MSNLSDAVLSHGLFLPTPTYVSVYDLRFGVDRGDGQLGTLTLPVVGDVRSGISYGGGGNQYTGTMVGLPVADGTWKTDSELLYDDLVAEFGSTFTYLGSTIDCVRTPLRIRQSGQVSGYDREVESTVDILRSDAVTIGLYALLKAKNPIVKRPICTVDSDIMEVESMVEDDDAEASIRILCVAKQ